MRNSVYTLLAYGTLIVDGYLALASVAAKAAVSLPPEQRSRSEAGETAPDDRRPALNQQVN